MGDSCWFVARLTDQYSCLLLDAAFVEGKDGEKRNKIVEKNDLFILAARAYCKSLSLNEDNLLLWHDLASCYLSYSFVFDKEDLSNRQEILDKALSIAHYCTKKNPTYWQHWNLLGNVAFHVGE